MQVVIELGHRAMFLDEPTREGFTHNWTLFVSGVKKNDISHFVDKVVFYLHDSFKSPRRGCCLLVLLCHWLLPVIIACRSDFVYLYFWQTFCTKFTVKMLLNVLLLSFESISY